MDSQEKEKKKEERKKRGRDFIDATLNKLKCHLTNPVNTIKDTIHQIVSFEFNRDNRSLTWLILLNILPYNTPEKWNDIIYNYRSEYLNLKTQYITNQVMEFIQLKEEKGTKLYNEKKKKLSEKDQPLLDLIKIDNPRTFPELNLFSKINVRESLMNVLYIFAKLHRDIGYIQGMNEICGIIAYVIYPVVILNLKFIKDSTTFLYYNLYFGENFFEADLFTLFNGIMKLDLIKWYNLRRASSSNSFTYKTLKEKCELTKEEIDNSKVSEIKRRTMEVYYVKFKKYDNEYFNLISKEIDPLQFVTRYFLCLFSREFDMRNTLKIWDIILSYEFLEFYYEQNGLNDSKNNKNINTHFNFADFICLSMFDYIKKDVVNLFEENELILVLDKFMHFPKSEGEKIIKKAIDISKEFNKRNLFES